MNTNIVTLKQGFAGELTVTLKNKSGDPVDLTGSAVFFVAKYKKTDPDSELKIAKDSLSGGVAIKDAAGGVIGVSLTQAETLALDKNLWAEAIVKYSSTNVTRTKDIEIKLEGAVKKASV